MPLRRNPRLRAAVLAVIVGVWALSLLLPAVEAAGSRLTGFDVLLQGWRGTRAAVLAWYANPLFVLAVLFSARRHARAAAVCAALAVALSLTSFAAREIAAAAGVTAPPGRLDTGFYVWLAAQLALLAVTIRALVAARSHATSGIIGER